MISLHLEFVLILSRVGIGKCMNDRSHNTQTLTSIIMIIVIGLYITYFVYSNSKYEVNCKNVDFECRYTLGLIPKRNRLTLHSIIGETRYTEQVDTT